MVPGKSELFFRLALGAIFPRFLSAPGSQPGDDIREPLWRLAPHTKKNSSGAGQTSRVWWISTTDLCTDLR